MAWLRSEEEVDEMIKEMMGKGSGKYITQSVLFKKDSPTQMELLKKVLMSSTSFGAFVKQVLAKEFDNTETHNNTHAVRNEKRDTGNFF